MKFTNRLKFIKRYFENSGISFTPSQVKRIALKTENFLPSNIIDQIDTHILYRKKEDKNEGMGKCKKVDNDDIEIFE